MDKNEYRRVIDRLAPETEAVDRMLRGAFSAQPPKRAALPRLAVSMAAACLLLAVLVSPWTGRDVLTQNPGALSPATQQGSAAPPSAVEGLNGLGAVRGLPASQYTIDEGEIMTDRMGFSSLIDFYCWRAHFPAFAVVQAVETEELPPSSAHSGERRKTRGRVLYAFQEDALPETLYVIQNQAGGCMNDEQTNLLRAGGVYVLPLEAIELDDYTGYEEYRGAYWAHGDLDVLFEVDDEGLLYSHSIFEGFNRFDGRPLAELAEEIDTLERRPALRSELARSLTYDWSSSAILRLTVLDVTEEAFAKNDLASEDSYTYVPCLLRLEEGLYWGGQTDWVYSDLMPLDIHIYMDRYDFDLKAGGQYVLYLNETPDLSSVSTAPEGGKAPLLTYREVSERGCLTSHGYMIAEIGEDGTLRSDSGVFEAANGKSVDALMEMISEITAYYGK